MHLPHVHRLVWPDALVLRLLVADQAALLCGNVRALVTRVLPLLRGWLGLRWLGLQAARLPGGAVHLVEPVPLTLVGIVLVLDLHRHLHWLVLLGGLQVQRLVVVQPPRVRNVLRCCSISARSIGDQVLGHVLAASHHEVGREVTHLEAQASNPPPRATLQQRQKSANSLETF